jgi:hypothetical protein
MSDEDTREEEPMLPGLADPDFNQRIAELTLNLKDADVNLDELTEEIEGLFDDADNEGNLEAMRLLWSLMEAVRTEQEAQPEEPEAEVETEPEAEATEESEATVTEISSESTPPESDEGTAEMSTNLTSGDVPAEAVPIAASANTTPFPTIRVGGDIPGYTAGTTLTDMESVHQAMTAKVNSLRGMSGDGDHALVASIRYETDIPEERTLRPGDGEGNSRKIRQLIADPEQLSPQALTAAGWCAPTQVIYDVATPVGTNARPVRDSLPSFTADRGSISWTPAPSIASAISGMTLFKADGTTFTEPTGTTATNPTSTKQCIDITCGSPASATLDALSICLCFENLMTRAFPEWVRANTDLSLVAQARFAEQYFLYRMFSTSPVAGTAEPATGAATVGTPDVPLGVARDLLVMIRLVASQLRWKNRMSPTAPFQALLPSWVRDAMVTDLIVQSPGDATLDTSYAEVVGYLGAANISPIWYIDDVPAIATFKITAASDNFDSLLGYPADVNWMLYPTGSFVRLDAGSLDLGVVRTKEDVQKNKYCTFSETFEGIAYMGPADKSTLAGGRTAVNILGGYANVVGLPGGSIVTE